MAINRLNFGFVSPQFGKGLAIDVGASGGGSSKFQETDNKGEPVGERRNYPIRPFSSADDFVHAIAENARRFNREVPSTFPPSEKYDVIVAYSPGLTTKPGVMAAFSNLRTTAGQTLRNINFNPLGGLLGNPKARLISVSDVVGGLTESLHQLALRRPERYKPGEKVSFAVTGGGLGIASGTIGDKDVRITTSESGTVLDESRMGLPLELSRASVTAVKGNYIDVLRKDITAKELLKAKHVNIHALPGHVATKYDIAKAHFPGLTVFSHRRASNKAIDDYMDGLVTAFHWQANHGTTLAVLAGPLVQGVKDCMEKHPKHFKPEIIAFDKEFPGQRNRPVMEKVFLHRLMSRLSVAIEEVCKFRKFDVVTDIAIEDNTVGARHLVPGKQCPGEGSFIIPHHALVKRV